MTLTDQEIAEGLAICDLAADYDKYELQMQSTLSSVIEGEATYEDEVSLVGIAEHCETIVAGFGEGNDYERSCAELARFAFANLTRILTELQSTRQQLSALRDKWRERAVSWEEEACGEQYIDTARLYLMKVDALRAAADDLDKILKGTP